MSTIDPIDKALELSSGAVFRQCALQVNPHHYSETFRGQEAAGNARSHAEAIVNKANAIGVSVLAITDHNDVSGVPDFQAAAEGRGITIFPGFELTSSEGIHVLCIYPPDADQLRLGRFLGEFGIRDTQPSTQPSSHSFAEVLSGVREQGGITVAAHVTNNNGLFRVLQGQARIRAWRSEDLMAIQIPNTIGTLPQDVRQIVKNKNPDYRRSHAAGENLAVAVVNANDVTNAETLADRTATCWIKMSDVSIEGLRQAFLDPGSRIRLNPPGGELESDDHGELVALAWEGGFLDRAAMRLNSNLNVLVGGRGAGKSTVIESLRYVLGLDPVGEEASKSHRGIVSKVLRSGTKISLFVRSHYPVTREYRIERTIPNPPVVRDRNGQVTNLLPTDIVPRIEVYGQHEISELTGNREKLTRLLDRFLARDQSLPRRKADLQRDLENTRLAILSVRSELDVIEQRLSTLPSLEETLARFQEAGLEERLRERSLLVREETVLNSIPKRLQPLRECLESLRHEIPIDRAFLSSKAIKDLPGKDILAGANAILRLLNRDIEELLLRFERALEQADKGITEIRSRWKGRQREVQTEYERILRELRKSAVDGEEFIRLRSEIEELRPLRERESMLRRLERDHVERRRTLLAEWEDIKAQEFRLLDRAARKVSKKLRGRVLVEVTAAGNREPLFRVLRGNIGGRLSEAVDALATVTDFSLPHFVDSCRTGSNAVQNNYRIPRAQAKRLSNADAETMMLIEELELLPTTSIQLNTAPSGEPPLWQTLEDLSTGQKATAVLLLLLLESDAPLIVDQPEDDLDNHFITEGVVPRMREEKRRRQFIFSTHNANIPVLGDAELILGLTAAGGADGGRTRIAPEHMGSIDTESIQELVEDLLEGGKEAFETRRLKYGF